MQEALRSSPEQPLPTGSQEGSFGRPFPTFQVAKALITVSSRIMAAPRELQATSSPEAPVICSHTWPEPGLLLQAKQCSTRSVPSRSCPAWATQPCHHHHPFPITSGSHLPVLQDSDGSFLVIPLILVASRSSDTSRDSGGLSFDPQPSNQ